MPKTIHLDIPLSDKHIKALETVKSMMIADGRTGVTNATSLEEMYCAVANTGLVVVLQMMKDFGEYERYKDEVELGNEIDDILKLE